MSNVLKPDCHPYCGAFCSTKMMNFVIPNTNKMALVDK